MNNGKKLIFINITDIRSTSPVYDVCKTMFHRGVVSLSKT